MVGNFFIALAKHALAPNVDSLRNDFVTIVIVVSAISFARVFLPRVDGFASRMQSYLLIHVTVALGVCMRMRLRGS